MDQLARKMLDYKSTRNEVILNDILLDKDLVKYISGIARNKEKYSMTGLNTKDDLFSIGISRVWMAINQFKFYCPTCKKILKEEAAYLSHCQKYHNKKWLEPKKNIIDVVKYHVGVYIENALRKEKSDKNKSNAYDVKISDNQSPNEGDSMGGNDWSIMNNKTEIEKLEPDFSNDVLFTELVNSSTINMDDQAKEILFMLLEGKINKEIAGILFEKGRYKSPESASVMVSKIIKGKIQPHFGWLKDIAC